MMQEQIFQFHNTDVFYRTYGPKQADCLMVCVHGLTGNSLDCEPLAEALVKVGYRVASIDMPGRGKSGLFDKSEDYSYRVYMDVLRQFLDVVSAENYELDWYGISMGGLLGIRLAGEENSPIRKLILNDIGPDVPKADLDLIREYLAMEFRFDSFEAYRAFLKEGREESYGPLPEELWNEVAQNNVWKTPDGAYIPAFDPKIDVMFDKEPIGELDLWPFWDRIKSDILAIRGGTSTLFPQSILDEMIARRPGQVDVIIFEECGHVPPVIEQKQINPVVDWLNS